MAKSVITPSAQEPTNEARTTATVVRNTETGLLVPVRGIGALADFDLKIEGGIDLLEPVAEQVLGADRKRAAR